MLIPWKTEKLDNYSTRIKVIGGWIVEIIAASGTTVSITFVPDEQHIWKI